MCAEAFEKFLPSCMGFAAGCMIWMVLAEVVPDSFKVSFEQLARTQCSRKIKDVLEDNNLAQNLFSFC